MSSTWYREHQALLKRVEEVKEAGLSRSGIIHQNNFDYDEKRPIIAIIRDVDNLMNFLGFSVPKDFKELVESQEKLYIVISDDPNIIEKARLKNINTFFVNGIVKEEDFYLFFKSLV